MDATPFAPSRRPASSIGAMTLSAALCGVLLGALPCLAQAQSGQQAAEQPKAGAAAVAPRPPLIAQPAANEPVVQHIVVEDDNARIEELHVRGEAQRITVQPKGVSKKYSYEIQPATGATNMATGPTTSRGLVGQRLWSILSF